MIAARLAGVAARYPQAVAVVDGDLTLTYPALLGAAGVARRHIAGVGVGPGDLVIVSAPISWQSVAAFAACADLGATYMPINPAWREAELSWLTGRVTPAAVVIRDGDQGRWIGAGVSPERLVCVDPWPISDGTDAARFRGAEQPPCHSACYLVTSGSSGRPKIAPRTEEAALRLATGIGAAISLRPGRSLLACVPPHYAMGYNVNLLTPLTAGATLVLIGHFEPGAAARLIERHAIDILWASPLVFGLLADSNAPAAALGSLSTCLCGGAPLSPTLAGKWRRRYGVPLRNMYGSTETSTATIQSAETETADCVGFPIPGVEVAILDGDAPAPPGATGEIAIKTPWAMAGYLGEPEAARYWNGYFRSGDLGWLDERGLLHVAGRIAPWINTGGVKVDPIEVRRVLMELPGVRECAVAAEQGPRGLDVVAATLATEPGSGLQRADVVGHCRGRIAEYKIPRIIRFVASLATDVTGKAPHRWASPAGEGRRP